MLQIDAVEPRMRLHLGTAPRLHLHDVMVELDRGASYIRGVFMAPSALRKRLFAEDEADKVGDAAVDIREHHLAAV